MCKTLWLTLHLLSHHYNNNEDYNNENYGAGMQCEQEGYSFAAGYLNNSYSQGSAYLFGGVRVIDAGRFGADVIMGALSGYDEATIDVGGVLPMLGMQLHYQVGSIRPAVIVTPLYVHATLSISFGD